MCMYLQQTVLPVYMYITLYNIVGHELRPHTCIHAYNVHTEGILLHAHNVGKVTALGVLCCFALFVCSTLLASFFIPSHLSFKNMYTSILYTDSSPGPCCPAGSRRPTWLFPPGQTCQAYPLRTDPLYPGISASHVQYYTAIEHSLTLC